jgi:hypothetical protein
MTTETAPEVPTEPVAPAPAPAPAPVPLPPTDEPAQPAPPAVDYGKLSVPEAAPETFVASVRGLAEQHKLPLEAAQGVLDALATETKATTDRYAAQIAAWKAEVAADPTIGAQGIAHANTWLDTYGSSELREMLEATGLSDHPLLLKALAKAGKDAGESPMVPSNGGTPTGPWEDRFYSTVKPTLRN